MSKRRKRPQKPRLNRVIVQGLLDAHQQASRLHLKQTRSLAEAALQSQALCTADPTFAALLLLCPDVSVVLSFCQTYAGRRFMVPKAEDVVPIVQQLQKACVHYRKQELRPDSIKTLVAETASGGLRNLGQDTIQKEFWFLLRLVLNRCIALYSDQANTAVKDIISKGNVEEILLAYGNLTEEFRTIAQLLTDVSTVNSTHRAFSKMGRREGQSTSASPDDDASETF